ncbi:TIGR03085 family metal-binding protein [Ornithinimicrobium tianjinense]|uniref:TIGR03085 family protein n=1 Tax=Ornithinimicrobium tianjinense TaxID=1195761 RepID=A0A917F4U8_9MICO|nr:TIGR03085 family metal-binding protein [Ornithinimicrobium tianjinense]GGF48312.1 TIGR03085 family protein [Ornithinimicrobium tianjinense]
MQTAHLREIVASTALRLGPDAPTLCSPWRVQDLMAHLVTREHRADVLPGIALAQGPLGRHTDAVRARVAARTPLEALAEQVRSGPASWFPTRWSTLDAAVNTAELAIHHEDMVRAQPGWAPTVLPTPVQESLWQALRRGGRVFYRTAPVGVVLVAEGMARPRLAVARPPADAGTVVLRGTPLELLLHAFGRTDVARVEAQGAPEDVRALAGHRRGA